MPARLWKPMARVLDALNYADAAGLERGGRQIRDLVMAAAVPDMISTEIGTRYAQLDSRRGKNVLV